MSGAVRQISKIYVNNIPWTINSGELRKYFSEFGPVSLARVVFDKKRGLSKGFGYVTFGSAEGVESVLKRPHHILDGNYLVVQPTK